MASTVEYLIVGGGGGGSGGLTNVNYGSGGAGGTARSGQIAVRGGTYAVVVGTGGGGTLQSTAGTGGTSSFYGISATGGAGSVNTSRYGGSNADYSGGYADDTLESAAAGGGAGAGANGSSKNGGAGVYSSISGSSIGYGGGGGGNRNGTGATAYGATNGVIGKASDAPANRGGGGGGGESVNRGGNGGSGIVIIRYLTASGIVATGGTITTFGDYTIHKFTSSGTFTVTKVAGNNNFFAYF